MLAKLYLLIALGFGQGHVLIYEFIHDGFFEAGL